MSGFFGQPSSFSGGVITPTMGPSAGQQHTIPAVAPDTFQLLNAAQTFSNKTLGSNLAAGGFQVTGLGAPSGANDAATKGYADALLSGFSVKAPVRVATIAAIVLSGTQTINGVAVVAGDRVLVKNQVAGATNGIYVVAAGAWSRSTDADSSAEVKAGMSVVANEGTDATDSADTTYVLTTDDPIILGTTVLTFTKFSSLGQVTAGTGLTKAGNTLSVNTSVVPTYAGASISFGLTSQASQDLLVASSGSAWGRFAKGANNTVLQTSAGSLAWTLTPYIEGPVAVGPTVNPTSGGLTNTLVLGGFGGIQQGNAANGTGLVWSGVISNVYRMYFRNSAGSFVAGEEVLNMSPDAIIKTKAGLATAPTNMVAHGGVSKIDTTQNSSTTGGNTNLTSYSLPASHLGTNGDTMEVLAFGSFAANANNKQLTLVFGTTTIFDTTPLGLNGGGWCIRAQIVRTGAATQKVNVLFTSGAAALAVACVTNITVAETLSGALTIKCVGNATTANNDIVQEYLRVSYFPVN